MSSRIPPAPSRRARQPISLDTLHRGRATDHLQETGNAILGTTLWLAAAIQALTRRHTEPR